MKEHNFGQQTPSRAERHSCFCRNWSQVAALFSQWGLNERRPAADRSGVSISSTGRRRLQGFMALCEWLCDTCCYCFNRRKSAWPSTVEEFLGSQLRVKGKKKKEKRKIPDGPQLSAFHPAHVVLLGLTCAHTRCPAGPPWVIHERRMSEWFIPLDSRWETAEPSKLPKALANGAIMQPREPEVSELTRITESTEMWQKRKSIVK